MSALQRILNKKKEKEYGEAVSSDNWDEIISIITSDNSKFVNALELIKKKNKLLTFFHYINTLEPSKKNCELIYDIIVGFCREEEYKEIADIMRERAITQQDQLLNIVDVIVRCFFLTDKPYFSDTLKYILDNVSKSYIIVSNALTKVFPQCSFPPQDQLFYLKNTLNVCLHMNDLAKIVIQRVFQHLVALDCQLKSRGDDNEVLISEEIIEILSPQIDAFMYYLQEIEYDSNLLLQLFDSYLIDMPECSAVHFIFFYIASINQQFMEIFPGYLIGKVVDQQLQSYRSRQNAAMFLMTFVARSKSINSKFAIAIISYIADFALKYLNFVNQSQQSMDYSRHSIFFYSIQCILYVICWRHGQWNVKYDEVWNLESLIINKLDPLSHIDRNVQELFESLQIVDHCGSTTSLDRISVWFPFDPCPLESLSEKISLFYNIWGEVEEPKNINDALDISLSQICASRGITLESNLSTY